MRNYNKIYTGLISNTKKIDDIFVQKISLWTKINTERFELEWDFFQNINSHTKFCVIGWIEEEDEVAQHPLVFGSFCHLRYHSPYSGLDSFKTQNSKLSPLSIFFFFIFCSLDWIQGLLSSWQLPPHFSNPAVLPFTFKTQWAKRQLIPDNWHRCGVRRRRNGSPTWKSAQPKLPKPLAKQTYRLNLDILIHNDWWRL